MFFALLFSICFSFSFTSFTAAQQECSEERLRNLGVVVVSCAGVNRCLAPSADTPRSAPQAGSNIFVIGDSITYGMVTSGELLDKISAEGYEVSLDYSDTGGSGSPQYQVSGASVIAEQGRSISWGNEQATGNASAIASSDVLLVGLGTNDLGNTTQVITNSINALLDSVRLQNPDITIYWTNVYIEGSPAQTTINEAIENISLADPNMNIIPWGTSTEAPSLVSSDGIHPTGNYLEMADYVVGQLSNSADTVNIAGRGLAGCTCSQSNPPFDVDTTTEELYQNVWNYLISNIDLSPEAAAGVMGNLEVESGGTMDPRIVEFRAEFPGNRSPEIPMDFVSPSNGQIFRGNFGYGIVQWTSANRQDNLIALSERTNRSTGLLDLQLDFLLEELTGSYRSALAVLETPGVTIEEASDAILLIYERPAKVLPPPRGTAETRAAEIANRRERGVRVFSEYSGSTGVYSGISCSGTENGDIIIDLDAEDTSNIACATGTAVRDENITAFNKGEQFIIRTCDYQGYTINSQLSASLKNLVDQAESDGVPLSANNTFRSMEEQISVYNRWCSNAGITPTPPPYPKPLDEYARCPGGAAPGYSNHQMGFAIDFNCDGSLIPQSYANAQSNQCFIWLSQNAEQYGLYELGKGENRGSNGYEGWHWSVDGT